MASRANRGHPEAQPAYALRVRDAVIPLRAGYMTVGRSADCEIVVDEPLVSRRHARLSRAEGGVLVEDLSTNGVFIDGERIQGSRLARSGMQISVGSLQLLVVPGSGRTASGEHATLFEGIADTVEGPSADSSDSEREEKSLSGGPTKAGDAIALLGGIADNLLASGDALGAERVLAPRLQGLLREARAARRASPEVVTHAGRYALKLARATGKTDWLDYLFDLSSINPDVMPAVTIDELQPLVGKLPRIGLTSLDLYVRALESAAPRLSPGDKFLLRRLQTLANSISSRR